MQPKDRRLVTEQTLEDHTEFEVSPLRDGLENVVRVASQATADSQQAISTSGNAVSRVEQLETMAGLEPGEVTDGQTANLILQQESTTRNVLDAQFATGGEIRSQAKPDGTDQTALVQAELDRLVDAGGGALVLPSSAFGPVPIKVHSLTLKNDGTEPAKQPTVLIRGQGAHWSGRGTQPVGGAILEFTGTDTYGLLKTNGLGLLRIQDMTLQNTDPDVNTPFIYTTNTTLHIQHTSFYGAKSGVNCDQDAIVLGGVEQIESLSGWTHGFQGYGTVISNNFFSGIRTTVKGQAFANAVVVRDNTVWTTCGNPNGAAIEWDGRPTTGSQYAAGCVIEGNLIEMPNYKYGISLKRCTGFTLASNNFYDDTERTTAALYVDEESQGNVVYEGFTTAGLTPIVDEGTRTMFYATTHGQYSNMPPARFADTNYPTIIDRLEVRPGSSQFVVRPKVHTDGASVMRFIRDDAHPTAPGTDIARLLQNGSLYLHGSRAGTIYFRTEDGQPLSSFEGSGRRWVTNGTASIDTGDSGNPMSIKAYHLQLTDHNNDRFMRLASAQPSDGSLASGEVALYWDAATGELKFRGKNAAGDVIQQTIATT